MARCLPLEEVFWASGSSSSCGFDDFVGSVVEVIDGLDVIKATISAMLGGDVKSSASFIGSRCDDGGIGSDVRV